MKTLTPYYSGSKLLVENCNKIKLSTFLEEARYELKKTLLRNSLELAGYNIVLSTTKTSFGGKRIWFNCPFCKSRNSVLYQHPISQVIGCRDCLRLEYKSRRYKGMVENKI